MRALLFFTVFLFAFQSQAFDLMKCTSRNHGTIWASFGQLVRSDSKQATIFPTEIVLFAPDVTARNVYGRLEEALKVEVIDRGPSLRMEFRVAKGDSSQVHLLQLLRYDSSLANAALGNWKVSEEGVPERHDLVACSLN